MSAAWEMICGLEVHVQLATRSKLFCSCGTDGFGASPNSRICPVCTGQPGVLPVLNGEAAKLAVKAALALGCEIREESIFARKNYFYPDLPKAYQISQYEKPLAENGALAVVAKDAPSKTVGLQRIHMEEDAGKLLHAIGSEELDYSLVDFNRAGIPLVEIVSKPDIRSPHEAYAYLQALKEILQFAGVSHCDMEKGEMRVDANISMRRTGEPFGTRVEIKNLNSFKAVRDALDYEGRRQIAALENGERIVQETRLWDADAQATAPMRSKEEAHDYRYFPDPDLPPLRAPRSLVEAMRRELPELPEARRRRFVKEFGLSASIAEVLTGSRELADYADSVAKITHPAKATPTAGNLIATVLLGLLSEQGLDLSQGRERVGPRAMGQLTLMITDGRVSKTMSKEILAEMLATGRDPEQILKERGGGQVQDVAQLAQWVRTAIDQSPKAVADVKGGKDRAIGAIVGAAMKLSQGKANPAILNKLIKEELAK